MRTPRGGVYHGLRGRRPQGAGWQDSLPARTGSPHSSRAVRRAVVRQVRLQTTTITSASVTCVCVYVFVFVCVCARACVRVPACVRAACVRVRAPLGGGGWYRLYARASPCVRVCVRGAQATSWRARAEERWGSQRAAVGSMNTHNPMRKLMRGRTYGFRRSRAVAWRRRPPACVLLAPQTVHAALPVCAGNVAPSTLGMHAVASAQPAGRRPLVHPSSMQSGRERLPCPRPPLAGPLRSVSARAERPAAPQAPAMMR